MATKRKKKTLCGHYGGKRLDGKPCTRQAGWGTRKKTGRCKDHDESAEAKRQAHKKAFLESVESGTVSMAKAAQDVGVDQATIWKWRQADEEFDKAVATAKANSDRVRVEIVEDSLFKRIVDGDAAAAETIFFLTNRSPDRWKHRQTLEHTGPGGQPLSVHVYVPENGRDTGDGE